MSISSAQICQAADQLQAEHRELRREVRERSQRILDTLEREAQAKA